MRLLLPVLVLAARSIEAGVAIGQPAPPLSVDRLIGAPPDTDLSWTSGLRGRALVIEFWATWCTPCREQIPHLNELARKYRGRPVTFLALTDEDDDALVERFLKEIPIEGWVGIDRRSKTFETYGVIGRPTTVLVDAAGTVRAVLTSKRLDAATLDLLIVGKRVRGEAGRPVLPAPDTAEALLEVRIRPAAPLSVSGNSPGFMERKGRRFAGWGLDLKRIASIAYGFPEERIAVSDRLPKDRYDVVVVAPYTAPRSESDLLRQSLETAFDVRVSSELRATDVYILSVGTGGPRNLRRPEVASTRIWRDDARVTGVNATFGGLAQELEAILKKPVLDETGVRDRHDFALRLSGDDPGAVARALESQLGLALRPAIRNREYLRLQ